MPPEQLTKLSSFHSSSGDVLHGLKNTDDSYIAFGEAYFSRIVGGAIKGWKYHRQMTCNLIVPEGSVKFVIAHPEGRFSEFILGESNYSRLTIPPRTWFGFMGLSTSHNLVLNIADIPHDDTEVISLPLSNFSYKWI